MYFQLTGRPISKKNSRRTFKHRYTGQQINIPSEAYLKWEADAMGQIQSQLFNQKKITPNVPLAMRTTIYCKGKMKVDLLNAVLGLEDILQKMGIITNDELIDFSSNKRVRNCVGWGCEFEIGEME